MITGRTSGAASVALYLIVIACPNLYTVHAGQLNCLCNKWRGDGSTGHQILSGSNVPVVVVFILVVKRLIDQDCRKGKKPCKKQVWVNIVVMQAHCLLQPAPEQQDRHEDKGPFRFNNVAFHSNFQFRSGTQK